jgi:hypothetical protein
MTSPYFKPGYPKVLTAKSALLAGTVLALLGIQEFVGSFHDGTVQFVFAAFIYLVVALMYFQEYRKKGSAQESDNLPESIAFSER